MEVPECEWIFQRMLVNCKITKFQDVNFKIFAWVLVTPKILTCICKEDNIIWCAWCGMEGSLEHILLDCPETRDVHRFLQRNSALPHNLLHKAWILGMTNPILNPIIWVTNFVIYKVHLQACDGSKLDLKYLLHDDVSRFTLLFPILGEIDWSSFFRMEITVTPPHVTSFQRFDAVVGMRACQRYLPEHAIDSYPDLLGAVSAALEIDSDDLCLHVCDMLTSTDREVQTAVEGWLISYGITRK